MRMRGYLRMQLPAQSRLLLPRLCAAALLCLDPGLAFYVCAPELIAHSHAGLTWRRQMHSVGSAIRHGHCYIHVVINQLSATALLPP